MRSRLAAARGQKYVGVAELTREAARVLEEAGPSQERGTVSEVPDERTVRYYQAEGLISPAEEKQGTASVFGRLHLLQLLAVKHLQAGRLPIRQIRELIGGRGERELEALLGLGTGAPRGAKNAAMSYLESILSRPADAPQLALRAEGAGTTAPPAWPSSPPAGAGPSGFWERIEVEPGLELHVHGSYRAPAESKGLRRLARLVLGALAAHARKQTGKKGK